MGESISVLIVDDDPVGANATALSLERVDGKISATTAGTRDLSKTLTGSRVDCLVCAHDRSGIDAIAVRERIRRDYGTPDVPFVLFTDSESTELLSRAITAGVSEYVKRTPDDDCYRKLAKRIRNVVSSDPPVHWQQRSPAQASGQLSPMDDITLRRLAESNLIGVFLTRDLEFEYVNQELAEIFGYSRTELVTELSVPDIVYEDDRPHFIEHLQRREWNLIDDPLHTFRGTRKDETLIHVEVRSDRINTTGTSVVLGLLTDVTPRKRREKELKRYRSLVNTAGDIVYALDANGRFTFVNDMGLHLTGYSREEIIGKHASLVLDDQAISDGKAHIQELLDNDAKTRMSKSYEIALTTADGSTLPCETNITLLTHNGTFNGTVGVVRDVSKQQDLKAELRDERDQFAALFENITEPTVQYVMKDGAPHIEAVNTAFENVFGYSQEEVVSRSLDAVILPSGQETQANALNEHVTRGDQIEVEVTRETKDGLRTFRLSTAQMSVGADPDRGYAIYQDVTDQKRRQNELERQNKRLEEFASVVSHDLRQPLGIASGKLSIVQERHDSRHLDDINDALQRMESLIENVLTLARQGKIVSTPTPTDLATVVRKAWEMAGSEQGELAIEGPLAEIDADSQRLQELFENLFRNAIEHCRPDVVVTVGMLGTAGFYVEDDGPGIPPEKRERVFDRGYSTAEEGTGLGLVIVKTIVEAHGWSISVTEGRTGGARFEIEEPSPFQ
ncbi:PAS domain S-box protein [Halocatena pleomorpha]|uniref:histidine kinase n=1 Tax=Halocatena pleomorpha TaxID=1785090 RepID=A0A3P3RCE2_9EURY|nr:PAS domain S-box protein [Halocatena pleomorpha]RRJ31055.1 PAS domain S-box protein [Halocatena pleomorpha]